MRHLRDRWTGVLVYEVQYGRPGTSGRALGVEGLRSTPTPESSFRLFDGSALLGRAAFCPLHPGIALRYIPIHCIELRWCWLLASSTGNHEEYTGQARKWGEFVAERGFTVLNVGWSKTNVPLVCMYPWCALGLVPRR